MRVVLMLKSLVVSATWIFVGIVIGGTLIALLQQLQAVSDDAKLIAVLVIVWLLASFMYYVEHA